MGDWSRNLSPTYGVLARAMSAKGTAARAFRVPVSRAGAGGAVASAAAASMSVGYRAREWVFVKGDRDGLRDLSY